MSTSVSIGIYAAQKHRVQVLCAIVTRLAERAELEQFILEDQGKSRKEISSAQVTSELDALASYMSESAAELSIDMAYRCASGAVIGLSVRFFGSQRSSEPNRFPDGPIQIVFGLNDLLPALPSGPFLKKGGRSEFLYEFLTRTEADSRELFARICGIDRQIRSPELLHAAMYLESGWPSPVECSAIHHTSIEEFALDFERICRMVHDRSLVMPDLFSSTVAPDVYSSKVTKIVDTCPGWPPGWPPLREMNSFWLSLGLDRLRRLLAVSRADISAAIELAVESRRIAPTSDGLEKRARLTWAGRGVLELLGRRENPSLIASDDGRVTIVTNPLSGLWGVYHDMAILLLED